MRTIFKGVARVALAAVVVTACADQPNPTDLSGDDLFFARAADSRAGVLKRASAAEEATASALVCPNRKTRLKAAEYTLEVPKGAVDACVEITMTVPAGDQIFADFQPHGLRFNKPATVSVHIGKAFDLHGVRALAVARSLVGVYFTGEVTNGGVDVEEAVPARVKGQHAVFDITHFSKWCSGTGMCTC